MTATNHALTGAFIGLVVGDPWAAVPAAFASHFVCDAIPHFGKDGNEKWLRSKLFKGSLIADAALCIIIAAVLFAAHPMHWLLAIVCAFLATSPDLYWIGKFRQALAGKKVSQDKSGFGYFASVIQWFQKPIGIVIEAAWAVAMVLLILPFVR